MNESNVFDKRAAAIARGEAYGAATLEQFASNEVLQDVPLRAREAVENVISGKASHEEASFLAMHMLREKMGEILDACAGNESDRYLKALECSNFLSSMSDMFYRYEMISDVFRHAKTMGLYCSSIFCMTDRRRIKKTDYKTYVFQNPKTMMIKIGKSVDVIRRRKSLECASGVRLDVLGVCWENIETEMHQKFAHLRKRGEWFEDRNHEISDFVKSSEIFLSVYEAVKS